MEVRLRLFAGMRQAAGRSELRVELPLGSTVDDLCARLEREFPQIHLDGSGVTIAVNLRYVDPNYVLGAGDVVALLPPVGGG